MTPTVIASTCVDLDWMETRCWMSWMDGGNAAGWYSIEDIHMQEYEYDMSLNATASVRAVQRYDGIGTV